MLLALTLLALMARPANAAAAPPDPRFGIVEAFANAQAATEAGAGYTRVILRWDVIQPQGPADWKPANVPDPLIEAELAAGRQVVGLLVGTPAWAAVDPSLGARSVPQMDRWEAFVRGMAQQYRGRIRHWSIWNEPDVWDKTHPGATWNGTEADYFQLLKAAYSAIKSVDPEMKVTLGGLTYFWDWSYGRRQYLDRLLDIIVADPSAAANGYYFDTVVYHLYFKPLQTLEVIGEARRILLAHGMGGKEIWINETNAPPSNDAQELPWSRPRFPISLQEQAAFVVQEFALAFASGASRVEIYKMRNSADHPESIEPFGLLRADDSRRPAFVAYQTVTTYLRDFSKAELQREGSVYAVTFDRGGETTTVLWTMDRGQVHMRVKAIASEALLVDAQGITQRIAASEGYYTIDLPGATCAGADACFIGGAPRLLVEAGSPAGRAPLLPAESVPARPTPKAPAPYLESPQADPPVPAPYRSHRMIPI